MITQWGFEWAKKKNLLINPICPYINKSFLNNPDFIHFRY